MITNIIAILNFKGYSTFDMKDTVVKSSPHKREGVLKKLFVIKDNWFVEYLDEVGKSQVRPLENMSEMMIATISQRVKLIK